MTTMSIFEQASTDLRTAKLTLHKLGETFNNFQLQSSSMFRLSEKVQSIGPSFATAYNLLSTRVKELESKEKEINAREDMLRTQQEGIELKRQELELVERSSIEMLDEVVLRQEEAKKWLEFIHSQRKEIGDKWKELEVKEKRIEERCKAVELDRSKIVKLGILLKHKEKVINKKRVDVEAKEKEVKECMEEIEKVKKRLEEIEKEKDEREKTSTAAAAVAVANEVIEDNEEGSTRASDRVSIKSEQSDTDSIESVLDEIDEDLKKGNVEVIDLREEKRRKVTPEQRNEQSSGAQGWPYGYQYPGFPEKAIFL